MLRTGKIVETKNSYRLATMAKNSIDYSDFANKIRKLLAYQQEKGITQAVEVVSTQGFSDDVINYLQRLKDLGFNVTWRVI